MPAAVANFRILKRVPENYRFIYKKASEDMDASRKLEIKTHGSVSCGQRIRHATPCVVQIWKLITKIPGAAHDGVSGYRV